MADCKTVKINNIDFTPIEGVRYKHDYVDIANILSDASRWRKHLQIPPEIPDSEITTDKVQRSIFRYLILNDLWFILYFVIGIKVSNHKFAVDMCKMVEDGPQSGTLDIWSRYHFKSSIITVAETVQYHLKNPEESTCIFSFRLDSAEGFLTSIKNIYEKEIMKFSFPDILYANPDKESPCWGLKGLTLKRNNTARKEATIEASGLIDGAPVGGRYERKVFDDIETDRIARSIDEMNKCFSSFEMASYLGTGKDSDKDRVVGTFYNHAGPLVRIMEKKTTNGSPAFITRIVPGTHDGTANGKPVFMSEKQLEKEKAGAFFDSQILCDPTPKDKRKLNPDFLNEIEPELVPKGLVYFLIIDPAGDDTTTQTTGDSWAIMAIGVDNSKTDEVGGMDIFITNAIITPLGKSQAVEESVRIYMQAPIINAVGIEKQPGAVNYLDEQIKNALEARGRRISIEDKSLMLLPTGGRNKTAKILNALAWPLSNSKIHISKSVPAAYRDRLKLEMQKFPYWHDDGLDCLSYVYDMIKDADIRRHTGFQQYNFASNNYRLATICG